MTLSTFDPIGFSGAPSTFIATLVARKPPPPMPVQKLTLQRCLATVATSVGMSADDLLTKTRAYRFSHPRQLVMWLARKQTGYSLPRIARCLGLAAHRTVIYGIAKVEKRRAVDPEFRAMCDGLVRAVTA